MHQHLEDTDTVIMTFTAPGMNMNLMSSGITIFLWNMFLKLFIHALIKMFFYNLVNMLAIVEDRIEIILNILVEAHTEIPM